LDAKNPYSSKVLEEPTAREVLKSILESEKRITQIASDLLDSLERAEN
jgi:CheY-like chemotaxis protein